MKTAALLLALLISFGARAGEMTAGVGHTQLPAAPAAGVSVVSGGANAYTTTPIVIAASTGAIYVTGIHVETSAALGATYISAQLMVGANGAETAIGQYLVPLTTASTVALGFRPIYPPIPLANASRLTVKMADSVGSKTYLVSVETITQTNVVDDGVAQTSNVTKWSGNAVAAPATAGIPEVNVKNINNVAAATPGASGGVLISGTNSGTTTLGALTVTGATIHTGTTTHTGNVVLSDGLTISAPSTGNRSGLDIAGNGTGAALKLTGGATGNAATLIGGATSGDGLNVTTTSGHGLNVTATGTAKNALNLTGAAASGANAAGSGISATGGAASTTGGGTSGAGIVATGGAGAASTNGAGAGVTATGGGTTTVSGNDGVIFTGTSNGNGLTAAHAGTGKDLNATTTPLTLAKTTNVTGFNDIAATAVVSSGAITTSSGAVTTVTGVTNRVTANADQLAGQTVTAAAGVTFPSSVASPTNITAGTITTATNLTNAPTVGDFTAAMKTSIGTAVAASAVASVTGNVGGNVAGSVGSVTGAVGSVTGLTASNLDTTVSSRMATYTQPTGFLAATFPTGTVANTTNITAGTMTTTTNLTTNNDKTGYSLAADQAVNATKVGGTLQTARDLGAQLDAAVSTRLATSGYTAPDNTRPANFTALAITAGGAVTAGTVSDKTGYALTSSYDPAKTAAQAGDAMTLTVAYDSAKSCSPASTALTSGTWTDAKAAFLDAAITSRLASSSYTAPDNASITAIKAKTDSLVFTVPSSLDVNVHHVNDVRLQGNGSTIPWGPQ